MSSARNSSSKTQLAMLSMLVVFVAATACGNKKEKELPGKTPTKSVVQATTPPRNTSERADEATDPGADPLLGIWRITEATGKYAEVNTGTDYIFHPNGKVEVRGYRSNPEVRARDPKAFLGPPETRELVVNEWAWKRISPTKIEMTHKASPLTAEITIKLDEDTMKFVWNTNGSIFTMQKIDQPTPAPAGAPPE